MSVFKRWNGTSWETIGPQISSTRFDDTNHMIAPEYSSTSTYNVGDYVVQSDRLYKCISAIESAEEWTAAHWTATKISAALNDLSRQLSDVEENQIPNLESALVSKKGENQVTPQNLEGMQFTKTTGEVEGDNIFSASMLFSAEHYVIESDGTIGMGGHSSFNAYCVPVDGESTYVFPECRFVVLSTGNTFGSPVVGTTVQYATRIDSTGANYLFLSYADKAVEDITVKPIITTTVYSNFILPEWLVDNLPIPTVVEDLSRQISDVESALPNTYVALAGENQVTPQNIAGMQFTKTEGEIQGENIFSEIYLGENNYYASVNTSRTPPIIAHADVEGYRWYAIPVDGVSKYKFTEARFACLAKGNTIGSEAIGDTLRYASEVTTTGASYLFLSYSESVTDIEVRKIDVECIYSDFIPPDWMIYHDTKPKYVRTTGNLSNGTFLALMGYKQNLRKGERYVFTGNITEFSIIKFGFTYANTFSASTPIFNEFTIDNTNITYKTDSRNANYTYQYAHGLTMENNLQFIFEYLPEGNAKITLISNGVSFTQTLRFVKDTISQVVALSTESTLTDCKLTWTPIDINKAIWMFGDSYFAYAPERWTYYLQQYGYAENTLLDGWPGEGSVNARNSLMTLIQFGTPKYVVWCMGMNDGSDTDASTPNSDWVVRRNEMLTICNNNNITPIFATIPNVPSILHTGKNAWIKASGYRYIDFAAAVGAESAGSTWFSGMLSSDNIHPSESGAKALFAQALVDFPEIMVTQ